MSSFPSVKGIENQPLHGHNVNVQGERRFFFLYYNGVNFNSSPPETKKFVDVLFKTLDTQVYDVAAASTTAALPTTAPTDIAPALTAEPAPTKMSVTKQPSEPLLSEPSSVANPPNTQTLSGHQVSFSVLY